MIHNYYKARLESVKRIDDRNARTIRAAFFLACVGGPVFRLADQKNLLQGCEPSRVKRLVAFYRAHGREIAAYEAAIQRDRAHRTGYFRRSNA